MKESTKANWKNVSIAPDRSKKERETYKKLKDEVDRRKERGEVNLAIRRGQIVTLQPEEEGATGGVFNANRADTGD